MGLQSALGPYSAPIEGTMKSSFSSGTKDVTQPGQGLGASLHGGPYNPDETKFLRELVGMQQVQMMELQRQISDLHSLVTGMANQRSSGLHQADTSGGSSQITAEHGATVGAVPAADAFMRDVA